MPPNAEVLATGEVASTGSLGTSGLAQVACTPHLRRSRMTDISSRTKSARISGTIRLTEPDKRGDILRSLSHDRGDGAPNARRQRNEAHPVTYAPLTPARRGRGGLKLEANQYLAAKLLPQS